MDMTNHASKRMQQRRIPKEAVELVLRYGKRAYDHRGGIRRFIDKMGRRKIKNELGSLTYKSVEPWIGTLVIQDATGAKVITVAHRTRRIKKS